MATFWETVQPTVWASNADCDECALTEYDYGPHREVSPTTSAHHGVRYEIVAGAAVYTCSCGWRDLEINFRGHLAEVRDTVPREYTYR